MRSSGFKVGPKSNDMRPYKRIAEGDLGPREEEEGHVNGGRGWSGAATSQGAEPLEAGRGRKGFFPRGLGGSTALLTP